MSAVAIFLLSLAGIFLVGVVGELVFRKTNVPDVIWLIAVGVILGPVSGIVDRAQLSAIAPFFAALTLIVVLFEGGSRLNVHELREAAPRSAALALATFVSAVLAIAGASVLAAGLGLFPAEWSWSHGVMLGCILGGSSSIIIMPAMAQARLEPRLGNLVGLESAWTDILCVVGTATLIDVLASGSAGSSPVVSLIKSFGVGVVIGAVTGCAWLFLLGVLESSEYAYPITLSALLVLYVVVSETGGSAALAVLTFAVILGNSGTITRWLGTDREVDLGNDVRGFHSQMVFIVKSFFFTFIGLMLGPPWGLMALGLILGLILYAVRIPGVRLATLRSGITRDEHRLVDAAVPRGMAAGVLSTMPFSAGVPGTQELPVVVFAAAVTTILVFAVAFPLARRRVERARRISRPIAVATPPPEAPAEPAPAAAPDATPAGEPPPRVGEG